MTTNRKSGSETVISGRYNCLTRLGKNEFEQKHISRFYSTISWNDVEKQICKKKHECTRSAIKLKFVQDKLCLVL